MLKKLKFILIFLCLFLVVLSVVKDKTLDSPAAAYKKAKRLLQVAVTVGKANDFTFKTRKITYNVYFLSIFPVGKMHFLVKREQDEDIYSLQVTTVNSWINRFIEADASVETHLDKESFLSRRYLEKTDVRGKVKTKEIVFDHNNLIAERDDVKMRIPEGICDPVGAFVQAITAVYVDQKVHEFKFLSKEKIYILKSSLYSEKNGLYELHLEMFREDSSSNHGARVHVWVTADEGRIPLLFKSWMPAGYGSVVIDSIEIMD